MVTFDEYRRFDAHAEERHEFVDGAIVAMAGGAVEHSRAVANVVGALFAALRGRKCVVLESNARVRVLATGNAYYPDASVVCGRIDIDPADAHSMTNPSLLVEVLSRSTESYDRGPKLDDYRRIPSLEHVVHVAHDTHRIDVWTRVGPNFELSSFGPGERAALPGIACTLDVDETYADPMAA